jgi:hypothetical protein
VALLACLGFDDERDLFPIPNAFPKIPAVVERPVNADVTDSLRQLASQPEIIPLGKMLANFVVLVDPK